MQQGAAQLLARQAAQALPQQGQAQQKQPQAAEGVQQGTAMVQGDGSGAGPCLPLAGRPGQRPWLGSRQPPQAMAPDPSSPAIASASLVTLAAVITYQGLAIAVGRARQRHGVRPPATSGPEGFERALRAQQNTLEQLAVFLPALWLACLYGNPQVAGVAGMVWVGARIAYAVGYARAPEQRAAGFGISFLASTLLLVLAAAGLAQRLGA